MEEEIKKAEEWYAKKLGVKVLEFDDYDAHVSRIAASYHQEQVKKLNIDNVSNCDHSNEEQRQGDGFIYTVCGDCGKDLD